MLTIKGPVELKCNTAMISSHEHFYHRIWGNYEMMTASVTGEDLLHVVTQPPQVFLGEGDMTSIVQNSRIENRQENKLNIINNLLNRIVLTEDVNLTYQDRVYITEVLNKLGIRNVQQFMNQVNRMKAETRNIQEQVSFYWSHLEELMELSKESNYREITKEEAFYQEQSTQVNLHQEIMNRLQTGAIYQILGNFYSSYNGNAYYVNAQELLVTEQKRTAVNVLLNRLQNLASPQALPMVFRHDNYYENQYLQEQELTEEGVNTQITSAVLLNLIDNLYLNRFEKKLENGQVWVSMEEALYQTADNTLKRVYYHIDNPQSQYFHMEYPQAAMQLPEPASEPEETLAEPITEEPDFVEELLQINQRNIENYERYRKLVMEREKEQISIPREETTVQKMRRESLLALHDPARLMDQYREEEEIRQSRKELQIQELTRLLPEQTRRIYERLEEYREQSDTLLTNRTQNNIGLLLQDIQQIDRMKKEQLKEQKEQMKEVSQEILEKHIQSRVTEVRDPIYTREQRPAERISMVYKTQNQILEEEMLEELLEQTRRLQSETRIRETVEEHNQVVHTKTVQHTTQQILQETQDLTEMIQKGVQKQIGTISDQVYNRLEKRLQNEKRRRGY